MDAPSPIPYSISDPGAQPAGMPVLLSGVLDQYHAESLKQQLLTAMSGPEGTQQELTLDMTSVEHLDAAALQILLACQADLQDKLPITGATSSVKQWIRIAGADALFEFSDNDD